MSLSKRTQAQIERRLITSLTEACETAKSQIPGFAWLTHVVDYEAFPASLKVVWVFDTQASKDFALADGEARYMGELTAQALADAGVKARNGSAHVFFDSEEECQRSCGGNWPKRLAQKQTGRS